MKLYAFAYAGGDGHVFFPMKTELKEMGITVFPYMYRGRNNRQEEGHYRSIEEIAEEAAAFIKETNTEQEYMIIGHSMGSLVAYECYQKILEQGLKLPVKMIFSGVLPPDQLHQNKYTLENDTQLVKQLAELGGMAEDVLELPEFKEYFLPIIKNDILIFDKYRFKKLPKIKVPVTVLTGDSDVISGEKVLGWKRHVEADPTFIEAKGNHFFLFNGSVAYRELFQKICWT